MSTIESDLEILKFCRENPTDESCSCLNFINLKKTQTKQPRYCTHPPCIFKTGQKIPSFLLRDIKNCGITNTCKFHIESVDASNTQIRISNDCDNLRDTELITGADILKIPVLATEIIFNDFYIEYILTGLMLALLSLFILSLLF